MGRRVGVVAVVAVVAMAASGCVSSTATGAPAAPSSVALTAAGAPDNLSIGLVVSLASPPGEGSDWSLAAEGAEVAAYRYRIGGTKIAIKPVDDKGNADAAVNAVERLAAQGVAGIIFATEGTHLQGALQAAAKAGIPVLLPYGGPAAAVPCVWQTGPSQTQVADGLKRAVTAAGIQHPLMIDVDGESAGRLPGAALVEVGADLDAEAIAKKVAKSLKASKADGVAVVGSAQQMATVVRALQGGDLDVPVVLGPAAASPVFATDLAKDAGSLSGDLVTVGTSTGDSVALQPDADGQAVSAYLAAVRSAAADKTVKDFFDDRPFVDVAENADIRSHDAVVSLVAAAAAAHSAAPADVAKALAGTSVTHKDGLAGPALSFGAAEALPADAVVSLRSSVGATGLRPGAVSAVSRLTWIRATNG